MAYRTTLNYMLRLGTLITAAAVVIVIMGSGSPVKNQNSSGISVKNVNAVIVDNENVKWFSTDVGVVSFDGKRWKLHDGNSSIPVRQLKGVTYVENPAGAAIWIASPEGATVARLPMKKKSDALTYNPENSSVLSQNVVSITTGKNSIRWMGTDKGVSALCCDKWLTPDYEMHYPQRLFQLYPITSMATNPQGDSLYVGTAGAGIARVYRDDLDGISGASVIAQWGPIDLPSDYVLSVYIAPDGTKWFGTEEGVARHTGSNTLDHWTVYTTEDGLVNNFVQAIGKDKAGNVWFGTQAGISVFDGSSWISYTTDNGLISNNILSLATDHDGIVWIGTEEGIASYENGKFISY
ncbi:MAG: two-component regulator propeller domain-containing protein [Bacteroidota bacterium]